MGSTATTAAAASASTGPSTRRANNATSGTVTTPTTAPASWGLNGECSPTRSSPAGKVGYSGGNWAVATLWWVG